jgi:hypothetical protein
VAWLEQISGVLGLVLGIRYEDRDIGWIRLGVADNVVREEIAIWQRDLDRLDRDSPRR